jgi:Family of unknown function (DUF6174)
MLRPMRLAAVIGLSILVSAACAAPPVPASAPTPGSTPGIAPGRTAVPTPVPIPAATPSPSLPPLPTDSVATAKRDREKALAELDSNRAKWDASHPVSYRYTYHEGCFCPQTLTGPFRVTVRVDTLLIEPAQPGGPQPAPQVRPAIEDVFAAARNAIASASAFQVTYDPTWGFPIEVATDPIRDAVDDESTITVSDFTAL